MCALALVEIIINQTSKFMLSLEEACNRSNLQDLDILGFHETCSRQCGGILVKFKAAPLLSHYLVTRVVPTPWYIMRTLLVLNRRLRLGLLLR
jgi:hypothetical protein